MAKPVKKSAAAVKKSAKPAGKSKPAPKAAKPAPKAAAKKPAAKPAKPAGKPAAKPVAKKPGVVSKLVQAVIGAGKKAVAKAASKPVAKAAAKPAAKPVVAKPPVKQIAKVAPVSKPAAKVAPKAPVSVPKTVTVKTEANKPAVAKAQPAPTPVIDTRSAAARGIPVAKAYAVAKAVVAEPAPKLGKKQVSTTSRKQEPIAVRVDLPKGYKPTSKDPYMGALQQEYFRQKLTNWRVELVEESKQTIDNLRDEVRDVGDEAERATRETENSLELRTRDRYRKLISKIDDALRRIDEGAYGYCVDTGDEIGLERLEARPTAERTVDAQERWEHRQKQMGD
jgi:DnaK suppressor protein